MSEQPHEPFKESNLESPEYRERLMRKLNTLIAVLESPPASCLRDEAAAADVQQTRWNSRSWWWSRRYGTPSAARA